MKISIFFILSFLFISSCKDSNYDDSSDFQLNEENDIISDSLNFKHRVKNTNYLFDIQITNISFIQEINNITEGNQLRFNFSMTNPYDKDLLVEFPSNFSIESELFKEPYAFYDRIKKTYRICDFQLMNSEGADLSKFAEYKQGQYYLNFKKLECKNLVLKMNGYLPSSFTTIDLYGFTYEFERKPSNNANLTQIIMSQEKRYKITIDTKKNLVLKTEGENFDRLVLHQ